MVEIAVIGAGPKGIALGAKKFALDEAAFDTPELTIFDKSGIGANWMGKNGYTNGLQYIVNPPEQDIGYPYIDSWNNKQVIKSMNKLSWQSFLVEKSLIENWVIGNRKCNHDLFGKYLSWIAQKSKIKPKKQEIINIKIVNGKWSLGIKNRACREYDSLIVSGNGEPKQITELKHKNLLDGKTFWEKFPLLEKQRSSGINFAILGAGETAGAIALAVIEKLEPNTQIHLFFNQPTFYSRGQSFGEIKWFANPEIKIGDYTWNTLTESHRRQVVNRADRGVVSVDIKNRIEEEARVKHILGRVEDIGVADRDELELSISYDGKILDRDTPSLYTYVVVAFGFEHIWFLDLCDKPTVLKILQHVLKFSSEKELEELMKSRKQLKNITDENELYKRLTNSLYYSIQPRKNASKSSKSFKQRVNDRKILQQIFEKTIDRDLSIKGFEPKLHLPMFGGLMQGPGIPNLNCLGLVSDRILEPYCNLGN